MVIAQFSYLRFPRQSSNRLQLYPNPTTIGRADPPQPTDSPIWVIWPIRKLIWPSISSPRRTAPADRHDDWLPFSIVLVALAADHRSGAGFPETGSSARQPRLTPARPRTTGVVTVHRPPGPWGRLPPRPLRLIRRMAILPETQHTRVVGGLPIDT